MKSSSVTVNSSTSTPASDSSFGIRALAEGVTSESSRRRVHEQVALGPWPKGNGPVVRRRLAVTAPRSHPASPVSCRRPRSPRGYVDNLRRPCRSVRPDRRHAGRDPLQRPRRPPGRVRRSAATRRVTDRGGVTRHAAGVDPRRASGAPRDRSAVTVSGSTTLSLDVCSLGHARSS